MRRRRHWRLFVAAATMVVVALGGMWLWWTTPRADPRVAVLPTGPAAPPPPVSPGFPVPALPPVTPLEPGSLSWMPPSELVPRLGLIDEVERAVLELTNAYRTRAGVPPLERDEALSAAARGHSEDMLVRRFFAHLDPDGLGPADRLTRISGVPTVAVGENLWMWSGPSALTWDWVALDAMRTWEASAAHRENLLRAGYTHVGVGVAIRPTEVRLTQMFRE